MKTIFVVLLLIAAIIFLIVDCNEKRKIRKIQRRKIMTQTKDDLSMTSFGIPYSQLDDERRKHIDLLFARQIYQEVKPPRINLKKERGMQ
ncbi:MAG: hypothetical protein Q7S33_02390 [Nanoarchaeota archaeon]|nr:hypothetical protein [Nanoarchaeota archaeon]